jgi:hypothetical protein
MHKDCPGPDPLKLPNLKAPYSVPSIPITKYIGPVCASDYEETRLACRHLFAILLSLPHGPERDAAFEQLDGVGQYVAAALAAKQGTVVRLSVRSKTLRDPLEVTL